MKYVFTILLFLPLFVEGQSFDTAYRKYDLIEGCHPKRIITKGDVVFPVVIDSLDEEGKMFIKTQYFSRGSGRVTLFKYNTKGRLMRREVRNIGSKTMYARFDYTYASGKIVMKEYSCDLLPVPELVTTITGFYDKQGVMYKIEGQYIKSDTAYTTLAFYDSVGRLFKEQRNYIDLPDGTNKGKVTLYTYDTRNRVISEFFPGSDDLPAVEFIYSYPEVDEKGNWTKRYERMSVEDRKHTPSLIERQIEYY